jgi:hypothetical protein
MHAFFTHALAFSGNALNRALNVGVLLYSFTALTHDIWLCGGPLRLTAGPPAGPQACRHASLTFPTPYRHRLTLAMCTKANAIVPPYRSWGFSADKTCPPLPSLCNHASARLLFLEEFQNPCGTTLIPSPARSSIVSISPNQFTASLLSVDLNECQSQSPISHLSWASVTRAL